MDNKPQDVKNRHLLFRTLAVLVVLFVILLILLFALPSLTRALDTSRARVVLAQAKGVQLAAVSTAAEWYALGREFSDSAAPEGIDPEAEQAIRETSGCTGTFYILQMDEKEHMILKMLYIEDEYTVFYQRAGEESNWKVFRSDPLIDH